jgi:hypothetical protein
MSPPPITLHWTRQGNTEDRQPDGLELSRQGLDRQVSKTSASLAGSSGCLCAIYSWTSYLLWTKPFAYERVSICRSIMSLFSGPNSGIPVPIRTGILVMMIC